MTAPPPDEAYLTAYAREQQADDRCVSWDHPVWSDGSQDHFQCELPDGHGGEHIGDEGSWSW